MFIWCLPRIALRTLRLGGIYLFFSRRGAKNAEKIVLFVVRMQYRSIRGMKFVRVSFHSGVDLVLPHLSPLPEGEG